MKRADESLKPLGVETAGTGSNQLERQRVNARQSGELVGSDLRKPFEERWWKIVMYVTRGGGDDVKVVEQPFSRRRHRLLLGVLCERRVDVAQRTHVLVHLPQVRAAEPAPPWRKREQRCQTPGVFLQQFDAE